MIIDKLLNRMESKFPKKHFIAYLLFFITIALIYTILSVIGMFRFGDDYMGSGWYAILTYFALFGKIQIRGVTFTLLNRGLFGKIVSNGIALLAFLYFFIG